MWDYKLIWWFRILLTKNLLYLIIETCGKKNSKINILHWLLLFISNIITGIRLWRHSQWNDGGAGRDTEERRLNVGQHQVGGREIRFLQIQFQNYFSFVNLTNEIISTFQVMCLTFVIIFKSETNNFNQN